MDDDRDLAIELGLLDNTVQRYTAIVMGQAGVHHDPVLCPGDESPELQAPEGSCNWCFNADTRPKCAAAGWRSCGLRVPEPSSAVDHSLVGLGVAIAVGLTPFRVDPHASPGGVFPAESKDQLHGEGAAAHPSR